MVPYRNLGGNSGIAAYVAGADFISVQFSDGWMYTYTTASAGDVNIELMKRLAASGRGLNAYINRYMRSRYASKMSDAEYTVRN